MNEKQLIEEIQKAAKTGESIEALGQRLNLQICESYQDYEGFREPGHALMLPGWYADDGSYEVAYPDAKTSKEAAQNYVDGGDWGATNSTCWVEVNTWRGGYAVALDEDSENPEVVWVQADAESHSIEVDPEEPECADGNKHSWCSPHSVVGGSQEDPGVWVKGGGVVSREVCCHCGRYRITDTWAYNHLTGEEGLTSIEYHEADEASTDWVDSRQNDN